MAGRRASRAAINGARRRGAAVRAARPAHDDAMGQARAERRGGHPGCVVRVGTGTRVQCVGTSLCVGKELEGKKKRRRKKEEGKKKRRKEKEKRGKSKKEKKKMRRRRGSRCWSRAERGVDEKRCARGTRRIGKV